MQNPNWIQDQALVLRKTEFGDTSLILTLFTREHGIVAALAKGAHRAKNPFWGTLDLPAHLEIEYPFKTQREVQLLAKANLLDPFFPIRGNLQLYYLTLYVIELLEEAGQPAGSSELFDLSVNFFQSLSKNSRDPLSLLLSFELHFLQLTGLQPNFQRCSRCETPMSAKTRLRYFPAAGGTLCSKCAQPRDREENISPAALEVAQKLAESSWDQAQRTRLAPKIRGEIRRAMDSFIRYHWERMPRTHPQVVSLFAASNFGEHEAV